jgi:hypothetical protein
LQQKVLSYYHAILTHQTLLSCPVFVASAVLPEEENFTKDEFFGVQVPALNGRQIS